MKGAKWDEATNIFPELFRTSIAAINPDATADDIDRLLQEITLLLENEDLGKAFYERLTKTSGLKLIDFENFDRNSFRVVTELPCKNGDDEFRPDITLLINGMPLIFTEVKKPNNLTSIKHSPEFAINKNPERATHQLLTALFSRDRLAFLLRFAFAYVKTGTRIEKHVMRYPQIFATKAIVHFLEAGIRKGIIWHTQGSGKTALAFYNVHHLTAWFQKQGIIPKFYFIVDRIDLLIQASNEFKSRGLVVHTINSREAFARDIKSTSAIHNHSGRAEITVVNIQKFQDDTDVVRPSDYNIKLQRVYFLDEVHRSYNPSGSFLANLNESDTQAIKIGLTGTPLIGDNLKSKELFGDYFHKYYYNQSIADGYTLRLIREGIETQYKLDLAQALEDIRILRGETDRKTLYARLHKRLMEKGEPTPDEAKLAAALTALKAEADTRIFQNAQRLTNPAFAEKMMARLIIEQLMTIHHLPLTADGCQFISNLVLKEYLAESQGQQPA